MWQAGAGVGARSCWAIAALSLLLAGCNSAPTGGVKVVDRANTSGRPAPASGGQYIVQRGDTLYSIAFRFGWDWKSLAARNGIAAPYVIVPGQRIRFDSTAAPVTAVARSTAVARPTPSQPISSQPVVSAQTQAQKPVVPITKAPPVTPQPAVKSAISSGPASGAVMPVTRSASGWAWPANGVLISRFSSNGSLNKGIDIAGELGQPVLAASDGTVVYAGSGLRGYGELVIIKHSDVFVSAYGHNRRLLVREGQKVKAGQIIAEMGSTGADRVKLHFEIRRQGKPVDPLQYLPSR